ncbi:MAG: hypothetical protein KGL39_10340, partial [Patescibacteria group bacterium]|nr:hypothetical protein [Patescibacteria group bacterium]
DKLENVIEIQIGAFCIPQIPTVPYVVNPTGGVTTLALPLLTQNGAIPSTDPLLSPLTQLPFCSKLTVEMKEIGRQSYADANGQRHHFELDVADELQQTAGGPVDTGMLLASPPSHGWDTFIFTDPVKSIDGLTLIFRNPDIGVAFPPSCLFAAGAGDVPFMQVSAAGQFLQFNYVGHGLNAGDRVFVRNFASGSAVLDNYVNSASGLVVGAGGLTANSFRFNPDVGTGALGLAPSSPIIPPSSVFGLPWATGPSAANSCAQLLAFAATNLSGQSAYASNSSFSLLWASGPNNAHSAQLPLGFPRADVAGGNSYTGQLGVALLWGTGTNAATSFRQHLSFSAQNVAGVNSFTSSTFSILWASGPSARTACWSFFGFVAKDLTGSNTYTGSQPLASGPFTVLPGANNNIDLVTGGPTLTASLAPGVYPTAAALVAALQTAISAVTDGFTVTLGATSLVTIARNGTFVVTNANNAIDFITQGGPQLHAFVANGSYSGAALAVAMTNAFAAVASPYAQGFTVTFNAATYQFTIARGYGPFTVAAGVNDAVDFNDGTLHSVTLPPGVYFGQSLATTLQSLMNTVSFGYTVAFNPATSQITIARAVEVPSTQKLLVTTGVNDGFDWTETSVKTFDIPAGTYSPATLASVLQSAMNAQSSGYTVAYSSASGTFTISRARISAPATSVCIAKNRMRIPLRMRKVVQRLTNYMSP